MNKPEINETTSNRQILLYLLAEITELRKAIEDIRQLVELTERMTGRRWVMWSMEPGEGNE